MKACEFCGRPFEERELAVGDTVLRLCVATCNCAEEAYRREKAIERNRELLALYREANLSPRFAKRSFESFCPASEEQRKALSIARHYVDNFESVKEAEVNSLYLFGSPGRGKTHLAVSVLKALVEKGVPSLYVKVPELLGKIRRAFSTPEAKEELLSAVTTSDFLVLDDLGAEEPQAWFSADLYRILDARLEFYRPTVVTSNLSIDEVGKRYGERIAERIRRTSKEVKV